MSLNPLVGGRETPANIEKYDSTSVSSAAAQPAAAPGGADGCSSSQPPRQPWPKLVLDSGASTHLVGVPKLLCNLRDAPAGMRVRVANGNTLPITKIGDIQMVTAGFTIPDVYLAPGLKSDLISVRELTRQSRICTWFDGDRATLYAGPELVGVAVAPQERNGVYVLESLSVPNPGPAATIEHEAPAATMSFPPRPSQSLEPTPKKKQKCVDSSSGASERRSIEISSKKRGKKYGYSNSGPSKRSRSASNQPEPFPVKVNAKTIVKSKKVKAKANNKKAARGGAKNDIVPFDSPAMATRSKVAAVASPAMATRSKRRLI